MDNDDGLLGGILATKEVNLQFSFVHIKILSRILIHLEKKGKYLMRKERNTNRGAV
jgi:hypothetical protein